MAATRNELYPNDPFRFTFPVFNGSMAENSTAAYKAWLQCMMAMNAEAGKFIAKRLQRDVQFPLNIVQCHTPQDVMQAQIEFFRTMAEDYSSQANKLGHILSESFHAVDRPETLAWQQEGAEKTGGRQPRRAA